MKRFNLMFEYFVKPQNVAVLNASLTENDKQGTGEVKGEYRRIWGEEEGNGDYTGECCTICKRYWVGIGHEKFENDGGYRRPALSHAVDALPPEHPFGHLIPHVRKRWTYSITHPQGVNHPPLPPFILVMTTQDWFSLVYFGICFIPICIENITVCKKNIITVLSVYFLLPNLPRAGQIGKPSSKRARRRKASQRKKLPKSFLHG